MKLPLQRIFFELKFTSLLQSLLVWVFTFSMYTSEVLTPLLQSLLVWVFTFSIYTSEVLTPLLQSLLVWVFTFSMHTSEVLECLGVNLIASFMIEALSVKPVALCANERTPLCVR